MTPAFRQGFMDKLAAIKSPEDLDAFYKKLKYRVLNKETNRPYFNTNFETFENWHLLSPEQIKKHKIGICYDTAAMTDAVLNELGIEHENRFAHSNTDGDWTQDPTHAYNIYKDKDGNWRWIEGSWKAYKDNDWKEKKKEVLLRKIKKALADAAGKKQTVHKVDKFPEPGIAMQDFYAEMLKNPVKKAELEKKAGPSLRDKVNAGVPGAAAKLKAQEAAKAYRAAHPNTFGSLNEQKAYLKQQGQKNLAKLTPEQRAKFWQDANKFQANALRFRSLAGSMMPGIGLAGAAGVIGAGETAASGLEGKSIEEAVGRGTASGALAYGGGKALEYVVPRAIGYAATKVPWIEEHVPAVKRIFAPLRRYALARNARDPFHRQRLTQALNSDLPKYGPVDDSALYLSHSLSADTSGRTSLDLARDFVRNGKYMPSMGLSDLSDVTWYGNGYGKMAPLSREANVRYFFDDSILQRPRTVIYDTSDAFTPTYGVLKKEITQAGGNIHDKVARERAYQKFYSEAVNGGKEPVVNRSAAFTPRKGVIPNVDNNPEIMGLVREVKPYSDVASGDIRSASIGVDSSFRTPKWLERELGDRGIPYYFVSELPRSHIRANGIGRIPVFQGSEKVPDYVIQPDEMAAYFAPRIKAK